MEEYTLVIMAAGMGSRFGGAKQVEPVDNDGCFILDYSIYDAIKAGFNSVVFIIKKEDKEIFESTIEKRLEDRIKVSYAFQEITNIPTNFDTSKRVKPWGTVQAVLSAKNIVNGKFLVINADDFYGYNSYKNAYEYLKNNDKEYNYATISYAFDNSVWGCEEVKRGVLKLDGNIVTDMIESKITLLKDKGVAKPLDGSDTFEIENSHPVSMNMFAFKSDIFPLMEEYVKDYFQNDEDEILNGEILLPEFLKTYIKRGKIILENVESESTWLGMTYREDLDMVKSKLEEMKKNDIYPTHLWF